MPHGATLRQLLRCGNDSFNVDAVVAVQLGDGTGLPELVHTQGPHAVAGHRTQPAQCSRMTIQHRNNAGGIGRVGIECRTVRTRETSFIMPICGKEDVSNGHPRARHTAQAEGAPSC